MKTLSFLLTLYRMAYGAVGDEYKKPKALLWKRYSDLSFRAWCRRCLVDDDYLTCSIRRVLFLLCCVVLVFAKALHYWVSDKTVLFSLVTMDLLLLIFALLLGFKTAEGFKYSASSLLTRLIAVTGPFLFLLNTVGLAAYLLLTQKFTLDAVIGFNLWGIAILLGVFGSLLILLVAIPFGLTHVIVRLTRYLIKWSYQGTNPQARFLKYTSWLSSLLAVILFLLLEAFTVI